MTKTMLKQNTLNLKDSYKNPFSEYNANVMEPETILSYWCNPFNINQFSEVKESYIYSDRMPIVFMGGRGTGKTMFLRYLSYPIQIQRAHENTNGNGSILSYFKDKGGIGFYIRIDGPKLRSFAGSGVSSEMWDYIFTHYFELVVGRAYLEVISDLIQRDALNEKNINKNFVPEIAKLLGKTKKEINSISDSLIDLDSKIKEVDAFRTDIRFLNTQFNPSKTFGSQSLSFEIPKIARETINEFSKNINFTILIDEYENFLKSQQRMVNTLLKFVKEGITFRIGMRLEGFRTFDTISKDDFIKEASDYRKIVFEEGFVKIKEKGYQKFLIEIAKKRLERVKVFNERGFLDISTILGKSENLEEEAIELTKKRPGKHFNLLKNTSTDEIKLLKNKNNPLMEVLNILWFSRGKDAKIINKAMTDYLNGKKTEDAKKYRMDYINKYKLSLMFLLVSSYRKNKKYYSFNTLSFLSSGIIRNFIELCRKSFEYAVFEDVDGLLHEGKISKDAQDKAAGEVANNELQQIQRIRDYGSYLYRFTINTGNLFRDYHKDTSIKYPETNQFSVDKGLIEEKYRNAFNAALEWSVIQKKPNLQQPAPGKHLKDIYTINRIFSPSFEITYRTRGGHSVELNPQQIKEFMTTEDVKLKFSKELNKGDINSQQQRLDF